MCKNLIFPGFPTSLYPFGDSMKWVGKRGPWPTCCPASAFIRCVRVTDLFLILDCQKKKKKKTQMPLLAVEIICELLFLFYAKTVRSFKTKFHPIRAPIWHQTHTHISQHTT